MWNKEQAGFIRVSIPSLLKAVTQVKREEHLRSECGEHPPRPEVCWAFPRLAIPPESRGNSTGKRWETKTLIPVGVFSHCLIPFQAPWSCHLPTGFVAQFFNNISKNKDGPLFFFLWQGLRLFSYCFSPTTVTVCIIMFNSMSLFPLSLEAHDPL